MRHWGEAVTPRQFSKQRPERRSSASTRIRARSKPLGRGSIAFGASVKLVLGRFSDIESHLTDFVGVDGIIADLGVSSPSSTIPREA